jgi:hypothetical protein
MSTTFMIGESMQDKYSTSYGPYWGSGTHTSTHGRIIPLYNSTVAVDYLPNAPATALSGVTTNVKKLGYAWTLSSRHPGGLHMLMGDGTVKFIKNSINVNAWAALATIKNNEIVSADSFE